MSISQIKKEALSSLKGRWGKIIGITLLYFLITIGISLVESYVPFAGIALIVITVPISFGYIGQMIKFTRGEEVGLCDYFSIGFSNFGKSWSIVGNTLLKLLVYIILYVVTIFGMVFIITFSIVKNDIKMLGIGIALLVLVFIILYVLLLVKSYLYTIVEYIGNDKPELTGKQVVEESARLMKGNRLKFFGLQLSFIGWVLLAVLTLGIGFIWLIPYMEISNVKFYEQLISENSEVAIVEND